MEWKGLAAAGARAWAWIAAASGRSASTGTGAVEHRAAVPEPVPAAHASAAASPSDAFDLEATRLRLDGDEDLLQRMLSQFALEIDEWERNLTAGRDQADAPALCRIAHAIKGTAANLGAVRLRAAAQEFEAGLRAGTAAPVGELASACLHELRQTRAALTVLLAGFQSAGRDAMDRS